MSKTCAFITLGCKVNQYDTQVLREALGRKGYREVPPDSTADLYVVNTCAVTSNSEVKSRQEIRKVVRLKPEAEVVVTGCYANADSGTLEKIAGVDRVVDSEALTRSLVDETSDYPPDSGISRFEGHSRAFLKIEDGCDAHCSYCIIPALRGGVRSKAPETILAEARRLAGNGYREVVLTGVHLGAYGRDLDGTTIINVLKGLKEIEGISRIRLSSLEAMEVTDELVELMAGGEKICPHLHLPLQSGDDDVLKIMNRRYTVGEYLEVLDKIRSKLPNPSFSTDIMVGFPGEGPEQFENTLNVCRQAGFSRMHIFPYSPRKGTPAASMQGRPDTKDVKGRRAVLETLGRELALSYKTVFQGRMVDVLVEECGSGGVLSGYSERYIKALFPGPRRLIGSVVSVEVAEVFPGYVRALWRGDT
ncbi:MAG: tRNA (N(6)-L-threonylcarbamoyladenosine(37)-C(2))-methylthiotransferase MtaB [Candidatus Brocadiales bacterium]